MDLAFRLVPNIYVYAQCNMQQPLLQVSFTCTCIQRYIPQMHLHAKSCSATVVMTEVKTVLVIC